MFSKGDRVRVYYAPAGEPKKYQGVEGTVEGEGASFVYVYPDSVYLNTEGRGSCSNTWDFHKDYYKLELIDEPVIEEDWS